MTDTNPMRQAGAQADELIRELAKQRQDAEARHEEQPVVPEESAPPVEDGVEAAPETDAGAHAGAHADPQPLPVEDDDLVKTREESRLWEQRYRSLDGMLQAKDRQIADLHQLIANMQAAPKAPPAEESKPLVSAEDEATFGADLLDVTRRVSRDELRQYARSLEEKLARLEHQFQGVASVTAETAQERFMNRLTQAVPNWSSVDKDPAFMDWLQAAPTRQRVFSEAARGQDVVALAQFYSDFEAMTARQAPPTAPEPKEIDPRLAKQVSPGRSRATPTPNSSEGEKRQWTQSGIADVYRKMANGQVPKEEAARLEREVFAAMKEGRVDYSR
jgi:hypothetical protein